MTTEEIDIMLEDREASLAERVNVLRRNGCPTIADEDESDLAMVQAVRELRAWKRQVMTRGNL